MADPWLRVTCTFRSQHPKPLGHVCEFSPEITLVSNTTSATPPGYTHRTEFELPLLVRPFCLDPTTDTWTSVEQFDEIEPYPDEHRANGRRVLPGSENYWWARRNQTEEGSFDFMAGTKGTEGIFHVRAGQAPVVYEVKSSIQNFGNSWDQNHEFRFEAQTFVKEHGHWLQRVKMARIHSTRHVSTVSDPV